MANTRDHEIKREKNYFAVQKSEIHIIFSSSFRTCTLAFRVAEEKLGIPALLDPEDMASCHTPDRLSILTYLSEFYHKFKTMQPKGGPAHLAKASSQPLKRHDSTDSAGMPLSRTPSSSGVSSGGHSEADSASSSSSICDSPPPLTKVAEEKENVEVNPAEVPEKRKEDEEVVVVRRKERSLASRRMVQSMYVESSSCKGGMIDSLLGESSSASISDSPSPDIERDNPFRDAMMKFASLEQKRDSTSPPMPKKSTDRKTSNRAIGETPPQPSQVSTATQTFGVLQRRPVGAPKSPFKTVLSAKVPSVSQLKQTTQQQPQTPQTPPPSGMTRTTTMRQLSYTSSPKPYMSGQINRSLSMGHALNSLATTPTHHQQQQPASVTSYSSSQDIMSSSYHGSASLVIPPTMQQQQQQMLRHQPISGQYSSPISGGVSRRQQQQKPLGARPTSMYTPSAFFPPPPRPLIWHSSPYSSSPSLYATPNSSPAAENNSIYYTPVGAGGGEANGSSSSLRYYTPSAASPSSGHYSNPRAPPSSYSSDRLKLHIEGQSSLV